MCGNLNYDLFGNNLRLTPSCECGSEREDADQFFFQCNKYEIERLRIFRNKRKYHSLNSNTLLSGCYVLSFKENMEIFKYVREYIRDSRRFNKSSFSNASMCVLFVFNLFDSTCSYMHRPLSRSFCRFPLSFLTAY